MSFSAYTKKPDEATKVDEETNRASTEEDANEGNDEIQNGQMVVSGGRQE